MRRFLPTFLTLGVIVVGVGLGLRSDSVAAQAPGGPPPDVLIDVIIAFDSAPGAAEEALVRGVGGTVSHTYHLVPAIAATLPQGAVQGLQNHPRVARIDLDGVVYADDELSAAWGVERIGAGTVHAGGNTGANIKVVVIDTGIDYTHPDLDGNYAGGHDFVNNDTNPMDDQGHGTHVSGTIAAEDDGDGVVGVAPEVTLYAVKVLNSGGSGSWSNIIAAMQWAVDNHMQVANLSLGASSDPGPTVQAAFDNAAAAGVVIVSSAGNAGNRKGKGDKVGYPAKYASVIAVAATTSSDARASYSSTGPDLDVAAPGSAVNSTLLGGGYGTKSGTSMASPHVAGTAALVLASGTAPADVRGILQSTADDLGDPGFDTLYGWGLVNAAAAAGTPPAMGMISGTVIASEGGAIEGAAVTVDGSAASGTTGADGTYTVNLAVGNYTVTASAAGFVTSDPVAATVTENTTSTGDFVLVPTPVGMISGAVTASGGGAIEGATVSVDGTALSGTTDFNGDYSISDVPAGSYNLTASAAGYDPHTQASVDVTDGGTTVHFSLTAASVATTVSVASIRYTTEGGKNGDKHLNVTVTLQDDLGPVVGASVSIELQNTTTGQSWVGNASTGESGSVTFTLKNHPSGGYTSSGSVTAAGLNWDNIWPDPANYSKP